MSAAVIVARGGSRRVPRKNIKPFMGRPMMAYPIGAAVESGQFSRVYVSTEDAEIAQLAAELGARVIERPPHLARDEVGTQEVMAHAVLAAGIRPEAEACCIYPCTPLLTPLDLRRARSQLIGDELDYVVAVGAAPLRDTGWFYYGFAHCFSHPVPLYGPHTGLYVVDEGRAIDVNTPEDWAAAESAFLAQQRRAA